MARQGPDGDAAHASGNAGDSIVDLSFTIHENDPVSDGVEMVAQVGLRHRGAVVEGVFPFPSLDDDAGVGEGGNDGRRDACPTDTCATGARLPISQCLMPSAFPHLRQPRRVIEVQVRDDDEVDLVGRHADLGEGIDHGSPLDGEDVAVLVRPLVAEAGFDEDADGLSVDGCRLSVRCGGTPLRWSLVAPGCWLLAAG